MKTITIAKKDFEDLKKKAEKENDLLEQIVTSLKDIKAGRIKPWDR